MSDKMELGDIPHSKADWRNFVSIWDGQASHAEALALIDHPSTDEKAIPLHHGRSQVLLLAGND